MNRKKPKPTLHLSRNKNIYGNRYQTVMEQRPSMPAEKGNGPLDYLLMVNKEEKWESHHKPTDFTKMGTY